MSRCRASNITAKHFRNHGLPIVFLLSLLILPAIALGRGLPQAPQGQERQPLGSLSPVGDVSVNGMAVTAETTIFAGDTVRTAMNGTATFTMSGKGSIKLSPQTQVMFSGSPDYLAELNSGTVVMNSFAGSTEVTLKVGNYVVGPVIQVEQSASKVQRMPDGSYVASCLDGSVGLVPLEGATGSVLQAGQSVPISAQGQLGTVVPTSALPTPPAQPNGPATPSTTASHNNRGWIFLGVVGAGATGVGITLATRGGSKAVSPASP